MPAKKRTSATRSASERAKRSRRVPALSAPVLSQAIEVPATHVAGNEIGQQTQAQDPPMGDNQVCGGSLDISSLVTAISASVMQDLQAADICVPPSSSSNPASDPSPVTAVTRNEVANITGLSGVTISTP